MRRVFLLVPLIAACGGSTAADPDPTKDDGAVTSDTDVTNDGAVQDTSVPPGEAMPCAVEDVIGPACHTCHGSVPKFGAPMSLVSQTDFLKASPSDPSKRVWEVVKQRVSLPPDSVGRMPQKPNPALTATQIAALDAWFA